MGKVLEEELEKSIKFFNDHNTEILKEHYRATWKDYEIPVVDLVFTCISCHHSHRMAIGRTPEGLRFIRFYDQELPTCEEKQIDEASYTKEELKSEIDSILGEDIEELDDVVEHIREKDERIRNRVEDPR